MEIRDFAIALLQMIPNNYNCLTSIDFDKLAELLNTSKDNVIDFIDDEVDYISELDYWDWETGNIDCHAILDAGNNIFVNLSYAVIPGNGIDYESMSARQVYPKRVMKTEYTFYKD